MSQEKRFFCSYKQGGPVGAEIWVDKETGVNYLYIREGFSAGLSPLLDAEGKPLISKEHTN